MLAEYYNQQKLDLKELSFFRIRPKAIFVKYRYGDNMWIKILSIIYSFLVPLNFFHIDTSLLVFLAAGGEKRALDRQK